MTEITISAPDYVTFKNTNSWYVNLQCQNGQTQPSFQYPGTGILFIDSYVNCLKDVNSSGAFMTTSPSGSTGGGAIQMGHAFTASNDPPMITLVDAPSSKGGYNTLWLKQGDDTYELATQWQWGHLELGNLLVHGSVKSYSTGAWLFSYYGGGGGGANGGTYLDAYGKIHFNGGTDAYYWQIFKSDGTEVFAVPNKTGSTAAIYINCNMNPHVTGAFGLGNGSEYWAGVVTNTIYRRYESSFDALDDLGLIKNYKTKKVVEMGIEKDVIDIESLPHLKGDPTQNDAELTNFWDESKVSGFLLGCVKALVHRVEALESKTTT